MVGGCHGNHLATTIATGFYGHNFTEKYSRLGYLGILMGYNIQVIYSDNILGQKIERNAYSLRVILVF